MQLSEFLMQRITEDEAAARDAYDHDAWIVEADGNGDDWVTQVDRAGQHWRVAMANASPAAHIARHDPARVLAECEAKRRIVELQAANDEDRHLPGFHYKAQMIERVLRILALPYADHPDYDEKWKL